MPIVLLWGQRAGQAPPLHTWTIVMGLERAELGCPLRRQRHHSIAVRYRP